MSARRKIQFGTRLDPALAAEVRDASKFVGLRPADLLRIGARMVIASIKANGGLRLGEQPARPQPKRRAAK